MCIKMHLTLLWVILYKYSDQVWIYKVALWYRQGIIMHALETEEGARCSKKNQ